MQARNLPTVDTRYWVALLIASVLGTTFGDFVSEDLGFTFAGAAIPLAATFGIILLAERSSLVRTVAWYWVAVVIFRSMATTLGDTLSRTLHLGYGSTSLVLGILLLALVIAVARRSTGASVSNDGSRKVLRVNSKYWGALLIASLFGTTFGDYVADDLGLGFDVASIVLVGALALGVLWDQRAGSASDARYWALVAMVRTAGTTLGDFFSEGAPHLGFGLAAICAGTALLFIVFGPALLVRREPVPESD